MKGKKILAGALSAAMLLSTMSFTAFAEELGNIGTSEPIITLMETQNTTVTQENAVAQVGDEYYDNFKNALESAQAGDTVTFLNDVEFDEEVVVDKDITIDFDNKKVTVDSDWNKKEYPTLFRIHGNVTVKNGNMDTSVTTSNNGAYAFIVGQEVDNKITKGSLVIENGTYKAYNTIAQASFGTIEVLDGDFSISPWMDKENENYEYMFNCKDVSYKTGDSSVAIKGGTFAKFDPSNNEAEGKNTDFVASGYKVLDNGDETYTVVKTNGDVINTDSASGFDVTLDNLHKNEAIKMDDDAIYRVVISEVKKDDKSVVDEIAKDEENEGKDIIAYDIAVTKTVNGETTEVTDVTNQQVTLTLPTAVSNTNSVKLYHIENGVKKAITDFTLSADGKTITFTAPSFSAYVIAYNAAAVAETEVTSKINVEFEKVSDVVDNEYNIVLKADSGKKINGLMTADLTFELEQGTKGVISYEVEPAANINLVKNGSDRYEFNANGINAYRFTGDNIVIGKVVFGGYCDGAKFAVKDLSATTDNTNVVYTTKTANSIVDEYLAGDKLDIVSAQINNIKIVEETKDLTVNVTFPNSIENQKADYQKMTVTIVSSDDSYEFNLGGAADTDAKVIKPDANGNYKIVQPVVKNRSYTVTVSGDGYRTARYTVNMNDKKVVNFWNNVKDTPDFVENGMDASKEQVTFLAGELVKDGKINIYDLSAVVSYFGTNNLVEDHPDYARYDLDRNGKIDSRDIAFVLVSWGK